MNDFSSKSRPDNLSKTFEKHVKNLPKTSLKLLPKQRKLQINKLVKNESGEYVCTIADAELDGLLCEFNYDECVVIDTKGMDWITLTQDNLSDLKKLIKKANKLYDKE